MSRAADDEVEALCQTCLRVRRIQPDDVTATCECGGDLCWCVLCLMRMYNLRAGHRSPAVLGLTVSSELSGWNERKGVSDPFDDLYGDCRPGKCPPLVEAHPRLWPPVEKRGLSVQTVEKKASVKMNRFPVPVQMGAERDYAGRGVRLYVFDCERLDGTWLVPAADLQLVPLEPNSRPLPFLYLGEGAAQVLMDDLWNAGLRPTRKWAEDATLAAKDEHLHDLRRLVFGGDGNDGARAGLVGLLAQIGARNAADAIVRAAKKEPTTD